MPINDPVPPDEQRIIDTMVQAMLDRQAKTHKPGAVAKRFLHGKSLGVANAIFTVDKLPEELRVGLFATPRDYRAIVRFSNGAFSKNVPDALPNVRGLAVKLFDVAGTKQLSGEEYSDEMDFILANDSTFFVSKIEHMLLLTEGKFAQILTHYPGTILRALAASHKFVSSVLGIDYFAQVPYRFGDRACKFAMMHDQDIKSLPNLLDRDYLRHDLERQLSAGAHTFTFCVQLQQDGDSISDSTKAWRGEFVPLGRLKILQCHQEIKESYGESLAFNPMRTLAEHEALGWPGRLRREIYQADFKWRLKTNQTDQSPEVILR